MTYSIDDLLAVIKRSPETVVFSDVIQCIDKQYQFTEFAFQNGDLANQAGENNGSCKLFSFAMLQGLDQDQTLACFGEYYRDVMKNPNGNDHQNIRNFMQTAWDGVKFSQQALVLN
ncbi:MAG: HopJ type III effector protein [Thiotrichaceae bacterium]|nr:HopJ type III effector protein [Thiotrichaceae bacterium]